MATDAPLPLQRMQFEAMLRRVEAEADRDGTYTLDEVLAEIDRIIARHRK